MKKKKRTNKKINEKINLKEYYLMLFSTLLSSLIEAITNKKIYNRSYLDRLYLQVPAINSHFT